MKTLIVATNRIDLERLREASDEHLTHLRWLMQMGCYGKLGDDVSSAATITLAIKDHLARAGKRVRTVNETDARRRAQFALARNLMQGDEWDCIAIREGDDSDSDANQGDGDIESLDRELAGLLESLGDDTAILIVMRGGFILAAPRNLRRGETASVNAADIAATLLDLGGDGVPEWLAGTSLLAHPQPGLESGYTDDEEEIVRERLKGLGYI